MKKIILLFMIIFVVGCSIMSDTPTSKVESFMSKYQRMDSEVLNQLEGIINKRDDFSKEQKDKYRILMERQYQNMSYKIKDENSNDKNSNVTVQVEVYDYRSSLNKSEEYIEKNRDEFLNKDKELDMEKVWDYKIKEMKKTEDRVTNEIIFTLHKEKNGWVLEDISDIDRQKLHGLYAG